MRVLFLRMMEDAKPSSKDKPIPSESWKQFLVVLSEEDWEHPIQVLSGSFLYAKLCYMLWTTIHLQDIRCKPHISLVVLSTISSYSPKHATPQVYTGNWLPASQERELSPSDMTLTRVKREPQPTGYTVLEGVTPDRGDGDVLSHL